MTIDRRTALALASAILAGTATRAGTADATDDPYDDAESSDFPHPDPVTDPDVSIDALADQVGGNVDFALALLGQLRAAEPGSNLFLSPYSVSVTMAMAYAGARGETAAELADACRLLLEEADLHAAFGALEDEFELRNEAGEPDDADDDPRYQLSTANAVWGDENRPLDENYVDLLETAYGAGEHVVDFAGDPESAREEINEWVAERTNDRIQNLLAENAVDSTTRLVLTNAAYFRAAWEEEFNPDRTEPEPFTSIGGDVTDVETMHKTAELPYAEVGGHQLVELPYAGGQTSMVVLLPAGDEFESFEASLTVEGVGNLLEEIWRPEVELALPRFGIESGFSLVDAMAELGAEQAFDDRADFSGMEERDESELVIDDVVHRSFVEVDEEGTEAAAATATEVVDEAEPPDEPPERVEMAVDRPFLFYVRDRPTETPLFVGRVVDGETLQDD